MARKIYLKNEKPTIIFINNSFFSNRINAESLNTSNILKEEVK